jgi:hypothetical protein
VARGVWSAGLTCALLLGYAGCSYPGLVPQELDEEQSKRALWEVVEHTCDATDDPAPIERRWESDDEGDDEHELLVVPVEVEPGLQVPVAWVAIGGEDPDISPFRWHALDVETDPPRSRVVSGMLVEHRSADELLVGLSPFSDLTGQVVLMTLRRQPSGTLAATLQGYFYTDYGPPFQFYWEDLHGEVRLSTVRWEPGDDLALHLEVGLGSSRMCARVRLPIAPVGRSRRVEL